MVSVRQPKGRTRANSRTTAERIARSEEGTTRNKRRGTFGRNSMVAIATSVMRSIHSSSPPDFQLPWCPSGAVVLKGWSCAKPMTTARPLQKPIITGDGKSRMKRERCSTDARIINRPASITEGKSSSTPFPLPPGSSCAARKVAMIAAKAPVAPFTMAGRPPKRLQTSPTIQAACSATGGRTCARKAKATDSGIWAKPMVIPKSTSFVK
mmetsp:Transcript_29672/g.81686  ORF Transcript_29672/g.81686 Transcript_29672/m.81686 type:complete len:210 (-) Transcript_29672:171-800(-)